MMKSSLQRPERMAASMAAMLVATLSAPSLAVTVSFKSPLYSAGNVVGESLRGLFLWEASSG